MQSTPYISPNISSFVFKPVYDCCSIVGHALSFPLAILEHLTPFMQSPLVFFASILIVGKGFSHDFIWGHNGEF